jgi:opacity protein-like surface antigen
MKRLLLASCCLFAAPAFADDIEIDNPDQGAFGQVSKDLVDAFSYKALGPAEATGITGFAIGGFASYMSTDKSAWKTLTDDSISELGMAGVSAHKGLPFGIDVGAFYGWVPETSASVYGAELRYAILEGGVATPGVAVRGAFTQSAGVDDIKLSTYSLDGTISKGFAFVTPYAGAGYVWGKVKASGDVGDLLDDEKPSQGRVYVGMRVSAGFFEITPEYEHIGSNDVFNLRLGFSI